MEYYEKLLKQAENAVSKKNYRYALSFTDNVLIHDAENTRALKLKVGCLYNLKNYSQALRVFNRLLAVDDSNVDVRLYNRIFENYEHEKENLKSPDFYLEEFKESISDNKLKKAEILLNQILTLDYTRYGEINTLARELSRNGAYTKAILYYDESDFIHRNYDALTGKADALFELLAMDADSMSGDEFGIRYHAIMDLFNQAAELDKKAILLKAEKHSILGEYDLENKCYVEYLDKLSPSDEEYSEILLKIGLNNVNLNKTSEAIETFDKYLSIDKNSVDALFNRALTYYENKEYEKAADDFERLLKLNPLDYNTVLYASKAYIQMSQFDKALECYDEFIKKTDDDNFKTVFYDVYFAKAQLLANLQQFEQSHNELSKIPFHYFTKAEEKFYDYVVDHIDAGSTGFYAVTLTDFNDYNWAYSYIENEIFKRLYAVELDELEEEVRERGLLWSEIF